MSNILYTATTVEPLGGRSTPDKVASFVEGVELMFDPCHAAAMADSAPPWRHRPTLADRAEITRRIEADRSRTPMPSAAAGSAPEPPPAPAAGSAAATRPVDHPDGDRRAGVHCWVLDPHGARTAGLVLEWRRQGGRWIGLTAFVAERDDGRNELAEAWVDATQLRRITPSPAPVGPAPPVDQLGYR